MRQTATMAFRTSVMLVTLACIFGAALVYNSPERRADLLESILESGWFERPADVLAQLEPSTEEYGGAALPQATGSSEAPRWNGPTRPNLWTASDTGATDPRALAGAQAPANVADGASGGPPGRWPAESIAAAPPAGARGGTVVQPAAHAEPAGLDRFTQIERRLRELGATYYLLESWGDEASLFRFHCRMAIGGRRDHNRYFEATEADPLVAMEQVLRDVERWRSGTAW